MNPPTTTTETARPAGLSTREFLAILEERGIAATPQSLFYLAATHPHLPQPVVVGKTAGWPLEGLDAWQAELAARDSLTPAGHLDRLFKLEPGTAFTALRDQQRQHSQWPTTWEIHPALPGSPGYIRIRPVSISELDRRGALRQGALPAE